MGKAEPVTLTGVLSLKGNVPFSYLCLTDADGRNWKLRVPADIILGGRIGQVITVVVKVLPPRPMGPTPYPPEVAVTGIRN